eukprot:1158271-Pelagomonas_calceolata.AAC.11
MAVSWGGGVQANFSRFSQTFILCNCMVKSGWEFVDVQTSYGCLAGQYANGERISRRVDWHPFAWLGALEGVCVGGKGDQEATAQEMERKKVIDVGRDRTLLPITTKKKDALARRTGLTHWLERCPEFRHDVETNIGARVDLENLALSTLKYGMAAGHEVRKNCTHACACACSTCLVRKKAVANAYALLNCFARNEYQCTALSIELWKAWQSVTGNISAMSTSGSAQHVMLPVRSAFFLNRGPQSAEYMVLPLFIPHLFPVARGALTGDICGALQGDVHGGLEGDIRGAQKGMNAEHERGMCAEHCKGCLRNIKGGFAKSTKKGRMRSMKE